MSGEDRHGERIAILETKVASQGNDIHELQTDVSGLKRFQAWVFGVGSGVGAIGAFLAQGIKDRLGIG